MNSSESVKKGQEKTSKVDSAQKSAKKDVTKLTKLLSVQIVLGELKITFNFRVGLVRSGEQSETKITKVDKLVTVDVHVMEPLVVNQIRRELITALFALLMEAFRLHPDAVTPQIFMESHMTSVELGLQIVDKVKEILKVKLKLV